MDTPLKEEAISFTETPQSNLRIEESLVEVEGVAPHISNNKKMQAQLRMVVQTTYPEAQVGNSLNASIFNQDDFGFKDGNTYEENRVAWIDVPLRSTVELVQAKMNKFPKARIYKVLSLHPILTEEQTRAMKNGFSTQTDEEGKVKSIDLDFYKKKYRIPGPVEGEFADFRGLPQYRVVFFSPIGKEDIDTRAEEYAAYTKEESFKLDEAPTEQEIASRVANEF